MSTIEDTNGFGAFYPCLICYTQTFKKQIIYSRYEFPIKHSFWIDKTNLTITEIQTLLKESHDIER